MLRKALVLFLLATPAAAQPVLTYSTTTDRTGAQPLVQLVYPVAASAVDVCIFLTPWDDTTISQVIWKRLDPPSYSAGVTTTDASAPWDYRSTSTLTTCGKTSTIRNWSVGKHVIQALVSYKDGSPATDLRGEIWVGMSPPSDPPAPLPTNPTTLVFDASPSHFEMVPPSYPDYGKSIVTGYIFEVYGGATSMAFWDLGKPDPVGGYITVNIDRYVLALPDGIYSGRVVIVGPGGNEVGPESNQFVRGAPGPLPLPNSESPNVQ